MADLAAQRKRRQKNIQILTPSRCRSPRYLHQLPLADGGPHRLPVVIHTHVPRNGIEPRERRLAGAISVPYLMNAKPCLLQEVISRPMADLLRCEEPVKPRTDGMDQRRGRSKIAILIDSHQDFEIVLRVHQRRRCNLYQCGRCFRKILPQLLDSTVALWRKKIALITLPRNLSAFAITETELKLIAAAAIIGFKRRPKAGKSTPAARGTPIAL